MLDSLKLEKVQELAIRFLEARHGNLEMLDFKIEGILPTKNEDIWVVKCTLMPKIGFDEKIGYNAKVNLVTGDVDLEPVSV